MNAKKGSRDIQTAGENVYQYLRSSILDLQVKPGQTINISELSEFLHMSRSPIRDALIQLARDDLVTMTPQKGTIVSKIDITRARDERFMRACVEERVLEEFLDCCRPEHIAELRDNLSLQRQMIQKGDTRGFLRADDAFHSVFFIATNHPSALHNILNMSSHYLRIRLLALSQQGVCEQSLRQHEDILQLVQNGDRANIRGTIRLHIVEKREEEGYMIRQHPELFTGIADESAPKHRIWEDDFLLSV